MAEQVGEPLALLRGPAAGHVREPGECGTPPFEGSGVARKAAATKIGRNMTTSSLLYDNMSGEMRVKRPGA